MPENAAKNDSAFCKKLSSLWKDKRTYVAKLLVSAVVVFFACFTFFFFGPVEMTAFSGDSLSYSYIDILPVMGIVTIAVFALLSLLLALLKGKLFNYAVTSVFCATLCGYIQANLLNGKQGLLTGDYIDWASMGISMLLNFAIWIIIFIAVFLLLYFNKKIWKKALIYCSVLIIVMQAVPLFGIFFGSFSNVKSPKNNQYYFTNDGIHDYSKDGNVFVFLLDRLDYDYIREVRADTPDFFDKLDGFTEYTNAISEHARTIPAANFMFNACEEYQYKMPLTEYLQKSWTMDGKNILKTIKDSGYDVEMYADMFTMFGDGAPFTEYVSNLTNKRLKMNNANIINKFVNYSFYKYSPTAFKPFFWSDTNYYNNDMQKNSDIFVIDETAYNSGIDKTTANASGKCFKFYHFNGSHPPYYVNSDGTASGTTTTSLEQTKGNFNILFKTFEKMKQLGIYDDATIIITADHGSPVSDFSPLQKATTIGLFYKPSGSAGNPLVKSAAQVSIRNIPATLVKAVGADFEQYGTPLDEVGEDVQIRRHFYKVLFDGVRDTDVYKYEITGDANDFNNWKNIDIYPVEYPFYGA